MNEWLPEEEIYLHSILKTCELLSNAYIQKHRVWRRLQTRIKLPVIVIGSFTGITSFGSETFPKSFQKWISISVGVITMGIAILNTIESYFSIGEIANSSLNASTAFQQLREDINKELSIPTVDRQATGAIFIRDIFTRYQQILSQAPVLDDGTMNYIEDVTHQKMRVMKKRTDKKFIHEEIEIEKEFREKVNPKYIKSATLLRNIGLYRSNAFDEANKHSKIASIPEEPTLSPTPSSSENLNVVVNSEVATATAMIKDRESFDLEANNRHED